ncbi:hypothetical protein D9M72_358770 [compost metagenome]
MALMGERQCRRIRRYAAERADKDEEARQQHRQHRHACKRGNSQRQARRKGRQQRAPEHLIERAAAHQPGVELRHRDQAQRIGAEHKTVVRRRDAVQLDQHERRAGDIREHARRAETGRQRVAEEFAIPQQLGIAFRHGAEPQRRRMAPVQ